MPLSVIWSGEEKAQVGSYQYKITGAQTEIQEIPSKYKAKAFVTVRVFDHWDRLLTGASMLGDVQNPVRPQATGCSWSALSSGFGPGNL